MSILSTNHRLISIGENYSAGNGIDITDQVISVTGNVTPYSAGENIDIQNHIISGKDWSQDITEASSNAYNETTAWVQENYANSADMTYISAVVDTKLDASAWYTVSADYATEDYVIMADNITYNRATGYVDSQQFAKESACQSAFDYINTNKLNTEDFTAWQNGQYSTDLQTIEGQISNKLDKTAFSDVSGNFLTAAPYDMATTGDVAELAQTISETYQTKGDYATVEYVDSATSGKAYTSGVIDYFDKPGKVGSFGSVWASAGKLHAGYTAEAGCLYASGDSANYTIITPTGIWTKSANNIGTIDIQKLNATLTGFTAAGIEVGQGKVKISGGNYVGAEIRTDKVEISGGEYYGVQFRTQNTAMASAGLYYSNENVPRYAPLFSAKNASGDGFAIWAGGAKGFDASGNTIWDATAPAKLIGWSNYQGTALDPRAVGIDGSIIATVYPDNVPTSMPISSVPYSYMNGVGLYTCSPDGTRLSIESQQRSITLVCQPMSSTAQMNAGDVSYTKYNTTISANEIWSLTGSVQKREIEYDADTSAITAIAGSAIGGGGGGVTGEFVPQSAFDELKSSYNALSSLFATYSGQWLLPNEGV